MKEVLENISGGITLGYWISSLIFGFFGFTLYKWATYDPKSKEESPNMFSWDYWISNNKSDMFGGVLIFFIWVRFKNEIFMAFSNEALSIALVAVSDTFFIHILFGVLFTYLIRKVRKSIRKLKIK